MCVIPLLKYGPVAHRLDPQHKFRRNITQSVFSPAARPRTVRRERSHKIVDNFEKWLREERKKLSPKGPLAQAVDYSFNGWQVFMRFLADGRICLSNNAAERALRGIAVGRKNWTFCGSDSGGQRAAVMYTLIGSAKLSDVDPKAWLADVLSRIADHPARRIAALLPWNWKADRAQGETPQGA